MKYFITVALLAMIFNNAIGQITESKATQIAMEYIDNLKQMDYLVYRYPKPIDEKTIITTFDNYGVFFFHSKVRTKNIK